MSRAQSNPQNESEYLTAKQVCARYGGVSAMWLTRRIRDDSFPAAIHFGTTSRFFRVADIVEWERLTIAQGVSSAKPVPPKRVR